MRGGEDDVTSPMPSAPLPSFRSPPVQHVSFVLMLEPVPLKAVHFGLLWTEMLREKYPDVVDAPPALNQLEQFSGEPLLPRFQFQIMQGAPLPQVVFRTAGRDVSLGVQNDRLTHSWEAVSSGVEYPRYPALRESFERDADTFAAFCDQQRLGHIALRQIEVNYVNVLSRGDGWEHPGELHRVLQPWNPDISSDLGEPEDVGISQRYLVVRDDGDAYGRLHISIEPQRSPDGATTMRMALTFRGEPAEYSLDGIMAFLDDGHERIVRAFAAATTPEMHELWGREA